MRHNDNHPEVHKFLITSCAWNSDIFKEGKSIFIIQIPNHSDSLKTACSIFFFFFWLCWVFIAVWMLSLVTVSGAYSLVAVHRLLIAVASLVAENRL